MLYLVNTKTHEIIRDASGAVIVFSTNNEACNYAGALGIPCWVESQVYNPGLNRRK